MMLALCALAVLTMGAVALVRSVDTSMLVLGNLGFKKDAVAAGSVAAEGAITWLQNNNANGALDKDAPLWGYYATSPVNMDPTGATIATATTTVVLPDWSGDSCKAYASHAPVCRSTYLVPNPVGDNTVRFLITRLCQNLGPSSGNNCVVPVTSQAAAQADHGNLGGAGRLPSPAVNGTAYRILTRTVGTRGTVAFTETLVHF